MPGSKKGNSKILPATSSTEVRHVIGPVADNTISAILESGASIEE
jgi:hypothetical protein